MPDFGRSPRLLDTPVGGQMIDGVHAVGVDPRLAGFDPPRDLQGAVHIAAQIDRSGRTPIDWRA